MKRLRFILGAAALAAVALTASPAVNAQENGNRDEYGKVVRGPYETNRFGDSLSSFLIIPISKEYSHDSRKFVNPQFA